MFAQKLHELAQVSTKKCITTSNEKRKISLSQKKPKRILHNSLPHTKMSLEDFNEQNNEEN